MITWNEVKSEIVISTLSEFFINCSFLKVWQILNLLTTGNVILVTSEARDKIVKHVSESQNEMGGLLLGRVFNAGPDYLEGLHSLILVTKSIPSVDYKGTGVSLVMQTSVWNQARLNSNSMEFIVGWYHSHPNLGAFFSGTDKRTQQSFFYHDYSVGWVIDWVRGENSWFLGKKSQPVQLSHVIISLDVMR